jgi:lipopolysaccharide heptosyltransferase II
MKEPRRVLIVLLGAIGDVVRALPLAQRLRAAWPDMHLTWAVEPAAAPLLTDHPAVSQVVRFERPGGLPAFARFLREVRTGRADLALDLQRHLKSGVTTWSSRAPRRIGFHRRNSREGNWVFQSEHIDPVVRFSSKVRQFLRFADHLGVPDTAIDFGLRPAPADAARADALLAGASGNLAAIFLGSTWPSRQWFAPATAEVCRGLAHRGLTPVLIGAAREVAFAEAVRAAGAGAVIDCSGKTSLRDVVALLARARLAVGPDSGPMHIAAAVGVPVVSLWGATSPARSAPFASERWVIQGDVPCAPCYLKRCPIGRLCMERITPEAVLARVDAALQLA